MGCNIKKKKCSWAPTWLSGSNDKPKTMRGIHLPRLYLLVWLEEYKRKKARGLNPPKYLEPEYENIIRFRLLGNETYWRPVGLSHYDDVRLQRFPVSSQTRQQRPQLQSRSRSRSRNRAAKRNRATTSRKLRSRSNSVAPSMASTVAFSDASMLPPAGADEDEPESDYRGDEEEYDEDDNDENRDGDRLLVPTSTRQTRSQARKSASGVASDEGEESLDERRRRNTRSRDTPAPLRRLERISARFGSGKCLTIYKVIVFMDFKNKMHRSNHLLLIYASCELITPICVMRFRDYPE